jgi:hypothetical protein
MYYYDSGTLIHSTIAAQTIEPGEEITIPCMYETMVFVPGTESM